MALNISAPFGRGGAFPIDETLVLTKAEMIAINDNKMPEKYFCICREDGQMYLYDKSATPSTETGKYVLFSGGGGTDDYELLENKPILNGVTVQGNKESQDYKLTLSVQEIEKILYLD